MIFDKLQIANDKARILPNSLIWKGYLTTAALVKDFKIIAIASQDINKHYFENTTDDICIRTKKRQQGLIQSGEVYDTCPGCDTDNHAEQIVLNQVKDTKGLDLYLLGHYWICDSCKSKINQAKIRKVFIKKQD